MTAVTEMCGAKVRKQPRIPSVKQWFYEELKNREIVCPMKWYLTEEIPRTPHHSAALESLFENAEFWSKHTPNKRLCIEEALSPQLTKETINEIAEKTTLQFDCPLFCQLRQYRLTASNFGAVISAISRNSFPKTLFERILGNKDERKVSISALFCLHFIA